jgi:hypothetical protein
MLDYGRYTLVMIMILVVLLIPFNVSSQGEVTCVFDTVVNCNFWLDTVDIYIGNTHVQNLVMDAGWWADPYTLESVIVNGIAPCEHIPPITIYEPADCLVKRTCPKIPRYYMYTFRDDNQPETWQQYCYIISNNGYPSTESQARICGVPSYDYVYRATNMVYSGWVYTDCYGNATYGWQDWRSNWYRPSFAK